MEIQEKSLKIIKVFITENNKSVKIKNIFLL